MNVDEEIGNLIEEVKRLGAPNGDGKTSVKFGVLFKDDVVANTFEALVGTLRAAKKRKILTFEGEMLLSPTHDDVDVILL